MQQQDNSANNMEMASALAQDLDSLLNQHFRGRVVRKDLTKQLKEGANVPVYVLEYLLGMYCASDDDEVVEQGYSRLNVFSLITTFVPMKRKK
jgi:ATP-dependent Lon protease